MIAEKAKTRIEMAEATNNLAKMRFDIGVEKAMQVDIQRKMEEVELQKQRLEIIEYEEAQNKQNRKNIQQENLEMQAMMKK